MCGRYARRGDKQKITEAFHVKEVPYFAMPEADYNIAPTTFQPIIRESKETGDREIVLARWGLIPFFTKALSDIKALSTINAKAETIATARTWREPFRKRRCLVPVSAFYEWDKKGDRKPYTIDLTSGGMFAFAGLWDAWKDKDGRWLQSYAIVTTAANELMAPFHDRMPVIPATSRLRPVASKGTVEQLPTDLLRPYPAEEMSVAEANRAVGNVRNNGPEMLDCDSAWT